MKQTEATELMDKVYSHICKKGIPINVRNGGNLEAADWLREVLKKCIKIDEPLGVTQGIDYDHCPACGGIIGQSAYYCKHCGAYLRMIK